MVKRFSSTEGWLGYALNLARKQRHEDAQKILRKIAKRELKSKDLRLAAQVNARCELLQGAVDCWLEIERRREMEPGDYYMLGSLQMRQSKHDLAIRCFELEIEMASKSGTDYFLGAAVIRLADLMLKLGNPARAKEVLALVDDSAGDYIDGVGFRTKSLLLKEVDGMLGSPS